MWWPGKFLVFLRRCKNALRVCTYLYICVCVCSSAFSGRPFLAYGPYALLFPSRVSAVCSVPLCMKVSRFGGLLCVPLYDDIPFRADRVHAVTDGRTCVLIFVR